MERILRAFFMGSPLGSLALASLIGCSTSGIQIIENDEHPFPAPILATFSTLAYTPKSPNFQKSLTRFDIKLREFRQSLPLWYWEAPQAKTLFVLLPGFGSSPDSPTLQAAAEALWLQGFSVLSLPSTTHSLFARAASKSRRPGHLPRDLAELNKAISTSLKILKEQHPDSVPEKLALAGLSYGALQTVLWSTLDPNSAFGKNQKEVLNFRAFVAMSPPIDLAYALGYLDSKFSMGEKRFLDSQGQLANSLAQKVQMVESRQLLIPEILGAFHNDELEFLLAWDFRNSLIKAVLWPNPDPRSLDFAQYINKVLLPSLKSKDPVAEWNQGNSTLQNFNSESQQVSPSLLIFHTLNDILVREDEVIRLKAVTKRHMQLYRNGGHLGYVWSERFRRDLTESLKSLRDSEQEDSF